ncbi:hypothetical protein V6N13_007772 [Hibiscus sabdariffa]
MIGLWAYSNSKAITTRSGKHIKEIQITSTGNRAPKVPPTLVIYQNTATTKTEDKVQTTPNDIVTAKIRVDHETDRDASTTGAVATPQIRFQCEERIEDIRLPHHSHK